MPNSTLIFLSVINAACCFCFSVVFSHASFWEQSVRSCSGTQVPDVCFYLPHLDILRKKKHHLLHLVLLCKPLSLASMSKKGCETNTGPYLDMVLCRGTLEMLHSADVIMTTTARLTPRPGSDQGDGRGREEARRRPAGSVSAGYDWTLRQNRGPHDITGRHGQQGRGRGSACASYSCAAAGQP